MNLHLLLQDPEIIAWGTILAPILPLLTALLVVIATQSYSLNNQIKISNHQKRQTTFSALMGIKFLTAQLNVSRFEALIYSDYHEVRAVLIDQDPNSLESITDTYDFKESQRWQHKYNDLALEIAKNNQTLFELIGLVRILFSKSKKLEDLTNRILKFDTPTILKPASELKTFEELERWKLETSRASHDLIRDTRTKPIEDLLDYLEIEIKKLSR